MHNETELLSRIKQGETDKFNIIMDMYSDKMKKTAYLITGNDKISEDCVQEMFIRFYCNIDRFRGDSSLGTYLYRILVNECRREMRRSWHKRIFLNKLDRGVEVLCESHEEVSLRYIGMKSCLLKLGDKYREILVLYYFNDMKVMEISETLDISIGTVKSRLNRAREALKPYLVKEGLNR